MCIRDRLQNPPTGCRPGAVIIGILNEWYNRGVSWPRHHLLRIPIIMAPGRHPVGGFWPTSHVCRDGVRSRGPRLISSQNLRQDIVRKLHFCEFQPNRSLYIFSFTRNVSRSLIFTLSGHLSRSSYSDPPPTDIYIFYNKNEGYYNVKIYIRDWGNSKCFRWSYMLITKNGFLNI